MVEAADLGGAIYGPHFGDRFERDWHGVGGRADDHLLEVGDGLAFLVERADPDIDLAVAARQLGGDIALQLVAQQLADILHGGAQLGDAPAVEENLDFGLAAGRARADVGQPGNGVHALDRFVGQQVEGA